MQDKDIEQRLKNKKRKRMLFILIFFLILAGLVVYLSTRPKPLPLVRTAVAANQSQLKQTLSVSAEIKPFAIQTVPEIKQSILRIPVEVGQRVKKGDVLIVLGKKSLEDDLEKARAAREEAEASMAEADSALAAAQAAAASASEAQMSAMLNGITANLQSQLSSTLAQMTGQLRAQLPTADDFSEMTAEQLRQWQVYLDGLRADLDEWIARIPSASPTPTPTPVPTLAPTPTATPSPAPSVSPTVTPIPGSDPSTTINPSQTTATTTQTEATTGSTEVSPNPTNTGSVTQATEAPSVPSNSTTESSTTAHGGLSGFNKAWGGSAQLAMGAAPDLSQFLSSSGMAGDTLSSTMAQGEALLEQLKEAEQKAQEALDQAKTEIKAEVDGFVVSINAKVGEPTDDTSNFNTSGLATSTKPAMLVYDDSSLIASFRANRYDAVRIEKGQAVHYTADQLVFNGEVIFKSPIATTSAGATDLSSLSEMNPMSSAMGMTDGSLIAGEALVDVEMSVEGEQLEQLIIGFPIDAEITIKEVHDVLAIPAEALSKENDVYYVYVVDATDTLHKREVRVGIQADVFAEIQGGLNAGEVVVLNPTGTSKDGAQVARDD